MCASSYGIANNCRQASSCYIYVCLTIYLYIVYIYIACDIDPIQQLRSNISVVPARNMFLLSQRADKTFGPQRAMDIVDAILYCPRDVQHPNILLAVGWS